MQSCLELEVQCGAGFDLEAAVCSHGLFMMAPNRWDPLSTTLLRPLRLPDLGPVMALISQPRPHPTLHVTLLGIQALTLATQQYLLAQVKRMLRLSEWDQRVCREFREVYDHHHDGGTTRFVVPRVFRSPSLFEDMVKCILLCNCSWPRTLSMAQSLCDLQLELQQMQSSSGKDTSCFVPGTPAAKEPERKFRNSNASECLAAESEALVTDEFESKSSDSDMIAHSSQLSNDFQGIGNFPTPVELSKLDENFLEKRCKLGYRAKRILNLARGIVEGRIRLSEMEETSNERSLSSYNKLDEQLKQIDGFGPFTRANVLMCMGFYHVVPSDSETIRHLKQVHRKKSSVRTIERDVQKIYAKYMPFQFLAYWSELWHFYETRFGKFSEMPNSEYKLVTASNMRKKRKRTP